MKINGIIWDYDGTLADTRIKNLNVTKAIISELITGIKIEDTVLNSLGNYEQANLRSSSWRELYRNEFNMKENEIDKAGKLWTKYQSADNTEVVLFEGIEQTVTQLCGYPQGIVSQNSSKIIRKNLNEFNLGKYFNHIIGYEEVDLSNQKPHPDGLLSCISEITNKRKDVSVLYIGDHITDIECAYNANKKVGKKSVFSVLLNHFNDNTWKGWNLEPDFIANKPVDINKIVSLLIND